MKGKQLRTFTVNEREMIFNVRYFQELFVKFASRKNIGIGNYEYEVADALFVDKSTIHNWRMNVNGPGDIEKIQSLAKFWNINYENLLMEVKEMTTTETNNKKQLTESEKIALRNVYRAFLNYMVEFENTAGFLYDELTGYDIRQAYDLYEKVQYALKYEYIDLKRTVYDKLDTFVNGELSITLEGDEERASMPMEQIIADTQSMYERMMDSFKEIVDQYLV